jgi:hypothetical protein
MARRLTAAAAAAVTLAAAAPAATATTPVSPADRAATHVYLEAEYAYASAAAADVGASSGAVEALAASLSRQCPGVLAGAPTESGQLGASRPRSARIRGQRARQGHELDALELELTVAEVDAATTPNHAALEALIAAEQSLRWSDARVTTLVADLLEVDRESLQPAAFDPCADMSAWRASGFRTLPLQTSELEERLIERSLATLGRPSLAGLLTRYENAQERALQRRTLTLQAQSAEALFGTEQADKGLRRAIGLRQPLLEAAEEQGVAAASGTTAAGDGYTVQAQPGASSHRVGCSLEASVEYQPPPRGDGVLEISSGGGENVCLRGRLADGPPEVSCDEGLLTIVGSVDPGVRFVRLLLSDGRTIVSATVALPANAGAPRRIYVQAIKGPAPFPVSLSELDAGGRLLRKVRLEAVRACRPPPPRRPPTIVTLARGTSPTGRPFTIQGASVTLGRERDFSLDLIGGPSPGSYEEGDELGEEASVGAGRQVLSWHARQECPPHGYTIVYGILRQRGASVLARTPSGLVPLHRVPLPARLHERGALVYGVFPALPSQLLVDGARGRRLTTEHLAGYAREAAEFCVGWSEA